MSRNVDGEIIVGIDIQESTPIIKKDAQDILNSLDNLKVSINKANLTDNAKDELRKAIEKITNLTANVDKVELDESAKTSLREAIGKVSNLTANIDNAQLDTNFQANLQTALNKLQGLTVNIGQVNVNKNAVQAATNALNQTPVNLNVDVTANNTSAQQAQKVGQQMAQQMNQSIQQNVSLDDVIDQEVQKIMKSLSIAGDKSSNAFKEIKKAIIDYRTELKNPTEIDEDDIFGYNIADINTINAALANNIKMVRHSKDAYKELHQYIAAKNSHGSKVYIPPDVKANLGDDYNRIRRGLGAAFTSDEKYRFGKNRGMNLEELYVEINETLGQNYFDETDDITTNLQKLYNMLNSAKQNKYVSPNEILNSGFFDDDSYKQYLQERLSAIDAAEKQQMQQNQQVSNAIVQQEQQKQNAYQQTAQTKEATNKKSTQNSGLDLSGNQKKIDDFKQSLSELGTVDAEYVNQLSKRFENLGVKIQSIDASIKEVAVYDNGEYAGTNEILSSTLKGIDAHGQTITMMESWNLTNHEFVKSMDGVSKSFGNSGKVINDFQIKLNDFKTKYNNAAIDTSEFEKIFADFQKGNGTVEDLRLAFNKLENAAKTSVQGLKSQKTSFDPIQQTLNNMRDMPSVLTTLETDMAGIKDKTQLSVKSVDDFRVSWKSLKAFMEQNDGKVPLTQQWIEDYQRLMSQVSGVRAEVDALRKVEAADNSQQTQQTQKYSVIKQAERERLAIQERMVGASDVERTTLQKQYNKRTKRISRAKDYLTKQQSSQQTQQDKEAQKIANKLATINTKVASGDYSTQIKQQEEALKRYGMTAEQVEQEVKELTEALKVMSSANSTPEQKIAAEQKYQTALAKTKNVVREAGLEWRNLATEQQRLSLANSIEAFMQKNTRITKEAKETLMQYIAELRDLDTAMTKVRKNDISVAFKQTENSMRTLHKLGYALTDQFKQAAGSFTQWLSVSNLIMTTIGKTRQTVTELIEVDNILTEISKTSDMTKKELAELGSTSFDIASKMGRTATDYLNTVTEMSRSGFYGEQGEAMAQQALLAQTAGDLTADLANQYILATNAAYKLNGSTKELNGILDGQNMITNRNSVSMTDMAEAMSIAGSVAASYRVKDDEFSAIVGTIEAVTKLGGNEVGNGIKSLLINLQNVGSAKIVGTLDKAGASMTKMVNGVEELRKPTEILRDLSKTFQTLDEADPLRAEILTNVGGKYQATKLAALLDNLELYDKMLQDYAEGSGSAAKEAEKSANNVQGNLNKLSNTFTSIVNNIVNSDTLKTSINFLNELLEVINKLTDGLGGLGTVAMTAMGVLTAKGHGLTNYVTFIIVYKSPSIRLYNNAI